MSKQIRSTHITPTLFLLTIEHRHGDDGPYAFSTELNRTRFLAAFCRDWWDVSKHGALPDSDDDVIDRYFDRASNEDEFATCHTLETSDLDQPYGD